ncbi:MAG: hypothetical protein IK077_15470 [Thermoguttaceae bacterium]|nr:hypothetical protein [Thermoguttaceae bacterium]
MKRSSVEIAGIAVLSILSCGAASASDADVVAVSYARQADADEQVPEISVDQIDGASIVNKIEFTPGTVTRLRVENGEQFDPRAYLLQRENNCGVEPGTDAEIETAKLCEEVVCDKQNCLRQNGMTNCAHNVPHGIFVARKYKRSADTEFYFVDKKIRFVAVFDLGFDERGFYELEQTVDLDDYSPKIMATALDLAFDRLLYVVNADKEEVAKKKNKTSNGFSAFTTESASGYETPNDPKYQNVSVTKLNVGEFASWNVDDSGYTMEKIMKLVSPSDLLHARIGWSPEPKSDAAKETTAACYGVMDERRSALLELGWGNFSHNVPSALDDAEIRLIECFDGVGVYDVQITDVADLSPKQIAEKVGIALDWLIKIVKEESEKTKNVDKELAAR